LLVNTLENFQGTHILGASRGHLSDSVIFLLEVTKPSIINVHPSEELFCPVCYYVIVPVGRFLDFHRPFRHCPALS